MLFTVYYYYYFVSVVQTESTFIYEGSPDRHTKEGGSVCEVVGHSFAQIELTWTVSAVPTPTRPPFWGKEFGSKDAL